MTDDNDNDGLMDRAIGKIKSGARRGARRTWSEMKSGAREAWEGERPEHGEARAAEEPAGHGYSVWSDEGGEESIDDPLGFGGVDAEMGEEGERDEDYAMWGADEGEDALGFDDDGDDDSWLGGW